MNCGTPARHATLDRGPLWLALRVRSGDELPVGLLTRFKPDGAPPFAADLEGFALDAFVSTRSSGEPLTHFDIDDRQAAIGVIRLTLTEEQTRALVPGTYRWRLRWTAPGDVERTIVEGPLEISRQ